MPLTEFESFSIPKGRGFIEGLITPGAADNWDGLRLLHIAVDYQLPREGDGRDSMSNLVDFLVQSYQQYVADTSLTQRWQDPDFRVGMRLTFRALFDLDLTKQAGARGLTVEKFIGACFTKRTEDSEAFRSGKEMAWEYVQYLTAAILTNPLEEPIPA